MTDEKNCKWKACVHTLLENNGGAVFETSSIVVLTLSLKVYYRDRKELT